jgi:hypothetical protein
MSYLNAAGSALEERYTYQQVEQYWKEEVEPCIPHQESDVPWPLYLQELRQEILANPLMLEDFDSDLCLALREWHRRYCIAHARSQESLESLWY